MAEPFLYHWYVNGPSPPITEAVRRTELTLQFNSPPVGVTLTTGSGTDVTTTSLESSSHPLLSVTTTSYVPAEAAEYVVLVAPAIIAPFLYHWYVNGPSPPVTDEVSRTDRTSQFNSPPVGAQLTSGSGTDVTTTSFESSSQPLWSVTTTSYVPALVAEYVVLVAPAISTPPLYHWYVNGPSPPVTDEVSSTELTSQFSSPPVGVTFTTGSGTDVTTESLDFTSQLGPSPTLT